MYLQTYVVPVCLYKAKQDSATILEVIGTAFFINKLGAFASARHVFETAAVISQRKTASWGLIVKLENGKSAKSGVMPVQHFDFAPKPYDFAVGHVAYQCDTHLRLSERSIEVWQDVATYGYPLNAVGGNIDALNVNLRCHKGYIQRLTQPNDIPVGEHPAGFELSFVLSAGLSGAPLFVYNGDVDIVIGVCVGSIRSEILEDQLEEIDEAGRVHRETRLKIDQYGLAHDIRPLLSWRPNGFGNLTLLELANNAPKP